MTRIFQSGVRLTLLAGVVSANIIFNWVQPTCNSSLPDPQVQGCLQGQVCQIDNTCIAGAYMRPLHFALRDVDTNNSTAPRSDGRCGINYDDALCDPDGGYGPCCSTYGWCGSTSAHCLVANGCQSGCAASNETTTSTTPGTPTTSVDSSALASSSSAAAANSEPQLIPSATTSSSPQASSGVATVDGTCGATYNGTICGNWPAGSCCSMYGFCGNTTAHCGQGCQSGACTGPILPPAPTASSNPLAKNPGSFTVIGDSGVPAMHAALLPNGRVVFLDKVENYTQLTLPDGYYAYSSEYDPETNEVVPLSYKTNAFCSGGSFLANGTLISVGGNAPLTWLDPTVGDGFQGIRYISRSSSSPALDGQSWVEPGNLLNTARWYASVQIMPNGQMFVVSGSLNGLDPTVAANNNPTYEILDVNGITLGQSIPMDLLVAAQPYYMYPFVHLLNDGNLFIFVARSSEIFDVNNNQTVLSLPEMSGDYRTYPNTGGSVLLPLSSSNNWAPDIVICGGGAYQELTAPTDPSCGRIQPLSANATWEMDAMPEGRCMVEGTLLPDGTVVWLNGATLGAQGFGLAEDPAFEALLYDPTQPLGQRWTHDVSSDIPRLYHSVALLLLDGTVMVAGSNPVQMPVLNVSAENPYVTEFRVERYTPPYLSGNNNNSRPTNIVLSTTTLTVASDQTLTISFTPPPTTITTSSMSVVLYHGGFSTHSLHMGQRMLVLDTTGWTPGIQDQTVEATIPDSSNVAPPGPYMVFILVDGIPGIGQFVSVA